MPPSNVDNLLPANRLVGSPTRSTSVVRRVDDHRLLINSSRLSASKPTRRDDPVPEWRHRTHQTLMSLEIASLTPSGMWSMVCGK